MEKKMGLLETFLLAFWFILPAYAANASPVVFGGGKPIDGGRKFFDGRPIFGTWENYSWISCWSDHRNSCGDDTLSVTSARSKR
jgi:CDP-diglyceride synthetase